MLALMLSGLSGQAFTFHGYLDPKPEERKREVKKLEQTSAKDGYTQIFIETPYRNKHLLETLLETLDDKTWLCVAWDLTLQTQSVVSQPVSLWKKSPVPNLDKKAAIFLLNTK